MDTLRRRVPFAVKDEDSAEENEILDEQRAFGGRVDDSD